MLCPAILDYTAPDGIFHNFRILFVTLTFYHSCFVLLLHRTCVYVLRYV